MARIGTYAVVCVDFRKEGLMSRDDAEAWITLVEEFGQCRQEHTIEVVAK